MTPTLQVRDFLSSQSSPPVYSAFDSKCIQPSNHNGQPRQRKDLTNILPVLYIGSIMILLMCALTCLATLYRNTKIMEQNLELLDTQIKLISRCENYNQVRIRRFADDSNACPPCQCQTEPPTNPVQPHRNPVSVLNEDPNVGRKAKYENQYLCQAPHIHKSILRIENDNAFVGKEWVGKGSSVQNAKQSAAWNAIQNEFTHLISSVAEEYIPKPYNPPCNVPARNSTLE